MVEELAEVRVPRRVHNHLELEPFRILGLLKPGLELVRVRNGGRERDDGARREQQELLPDDPLVRLTDAVHLVKDDTLDPAREVHGLLGVDRRQQQDLQDRGHCH
jgi:hypothetical protein